MVSDIFFRFTVRIVWNCLFAAVVFHFSLNASAMDLHLQSNDGEFSQAEIAVVNSYFSSVISKVPPLALQRMATKSIAVSFEQTDGGELGKTNQDNRIVLDAFIKKTLFNRELLEKTVPEWRSARNDFYKRSETKKNADTYYAKHESVEILIESVLIHELFHIYDQLNYPQMDYLTSRAECVYAAASGPVSFQTNPKSCERISSISSSVSTLPEYLHLAGWPYRGGLNVISSPTATNKNFAASPFAYEYTSPAESFAVNMEYFLLDKNFKCHRPLLYSYLARYFNFKPFDQSIETCTTSRKVLVSTANLLDSTITTVEDALKLIDVDLKRVYQIHYLFAGKSDEMMSRWGHSMFRIVICSPKRTTVGPDCMLDEDYHLVASFGAYVNQGELNPIDGIIGNYPSFLFFYPFKKIIKNYTAGELREVYSLPIRLNENQKTAFLLSLFEKHWTYRGDYKFFSNNCAIEALSVIQSAFVYDPKVLDSTIVTPIGLLDTLGSLGLIQRIPLTDLDQAIKEGHYYPPSDKVFETAYRILRSQFGELQNISFEDYVNRPPKLRRKYIEDIQKMTNTLNMKFTSHDAFVLIEKYAYNKFLKASLSNKLNGDEWIYNFLHNKTGLQRAELGDVIKLVTSPQQSILGSSNYGIPLQGQFESDFNHFRKEFPIEKIISVKKAFEVMIDSSLTSEDKQIISDFTFNINQ